MNKLERIKRLVSIDEDFFPKRLKEAIELSGLGTTELAGKIGRQRQQINRYITYQVPPLRIFRKLCIELQVDPKVLLGLDWEGCDKYPENGVIYIWSINSNFDAIRWICPACVRKNIEYGNWGFLLPAGVEGLDGYIAADVKKISEHKFFCEYEDCDEFYWKLYELEDQIKNKS
jgi:hypothetical protein